MKDIIQSALSKAMNYAQYEALFSRLTEEGRTTGEQTQEKIDYTKLNYSRSRRLNRTGEVSAEAARVFKNLEEKIIWLVITEPWCGDAAQALPFLNKLAEYSSNIDLKLVLRDENPELMDGFLTNNTRSIPKLIGLDPELKVIHLWGPRSEAAAGLVMDYKKEHGVIDDVLKENLQRWYHNDKGRSIVQELTAIVSEIGKEVSS